MKLRYMINFKEQEIVAIANNHNSGREVGAKLSNLSLHYLEEKQYLDNDYVMNYKTTGPDGKLMRSATYFIKGLVRKCQ
ncbi:MAG: PAS domain-containing protein [Thomasclavelia ramosa]